MNVMNSECNSAGFIGWVPNGGSSDGEAPAPQDPDWVDQEMSISRAKDGGELISSGGARWGQEEDFESV